MAINDSPFFSGADCPSEGVPRWGQDGPDCRKSRENVSIYNTFQFSTQPEPISPPTNNEIRLDNSLGSATTPYILTPGGPSADHRLTVPGENLLGGGTLAWQLASLGDAGVPLHYYDNNRTVNSCLDGRGFCVTSPVIWDSNTRTRMVRRSIVSSTT